MKHGYEALIAVASTLLLALPAAAQSTSEIDQIRPQQPSSGADRSGSTQIVHPEQSKRDPAGTTLQAGARETRPTPVNQLSTVGERQRSPQLYRGGRTAQPSAPLSTPAEGRNTAVSAVQGDDRCDPQLAAQAPLPEQCSRVIETRSAEFAPPAPTPLSPEQRILIENQAQAEASAGAIRRLSTRADANAFSDQALASTVLDAAQDAPPATPEAEPAMDAATAAIIEAIARQGTPQ